VEPQLDTIHQNEVTLKSGGYLVLNQTEALVAIDVNSGKATRERNIEETALKTNLEAAEEVGRQLKLRDLSGLIVIDFIDMDENRNQNAVERRLKDALRHDRARIQVGSISHFGLLEMSRQRLRPSLVESVSQSCPHCLGTGRVRSVNSSALHILRIVEEEAQRVPDKDITIFVNGEVALYILNQKRASLAQLESQFGISILIEADASLLPADHRFEGQRDDRRDNQRDDRRNDRRGDQRNGRRGDRRGDQQERTQNQNQERNQERNGPPVDEDGDEDQPKRRRRGKRGGRRRKRRGGEDENITNENQVAVETGNPNEGEAAPTPDAAEENTEPKKPRRSRRRRRPSGDNEAAAHTEQVAEQNNTSKSNDGAAAATSEQNTGAQNTGTADSGEKAAPKAQKASKKAAKKPAKKAAKAKTKKAATSDEGDTASAKTKAPKTPKTPKSKAKAPKKGAKAAKAKTAPAADSGANSDKDSGAERAPASSVEIKVVNIDESDVPKTKKGGWWSR
jgi:ribonuclease E